MAAKQIAWTLAARQDLLRTLSYLVLVVHARAAAERLLDEMRENLVTILAVGVKDRHRVLIGGEEVELR